MSQNVRKGKIKFLFIKCLLSQSSKHNGIKYSHFEDLYPCPKEWHDSAEL